MNKAINIFQFTNFSSLILGSLFFFKVKKTFVIHEIIKKQPGFNAKIRINNDCFAYM